MMKFYKVPKKENNPDGNRFDVYMRIIGLDYYVCDMIDDDTAEAAAINAQGLTLRARLDRSNGKYAMLEGEVFNPERLLRSACEISAFKRDDFTDGDYKTGYTLLTVTADGITNKYLIFDPSLRNSLINEIEKRMRRGRKKPEDLQIGSSSSCTAPL